MRSPSTRNHGVTGAMPSFPISFQHQSYWRKRLKQSVAVETCCLTLDPHITARFLPFMKSVSEISVTGWTSMVKPFTQQHRGLIKMIPPRLVSGKQTNKIFISNLCLFYVKNQLRKVNLFSSQREDSTLIIISVINFHWPSCVSWFLGIHKVKLPILLVLNPSMP